MFHHPQGQSIDPVGEHDEEEQVEDVQFEKLDGGYLTDCQVAEENERTERQNEDQHGPEEYEHSDNQQNEPVARVG
jgi:hypothetical protein